MELQVRRRTYLKLWIGPQGGLLADAVKANIFDAAQEDHAPTASSPGSIVTISECNEEAEIKSSMNRRRHNGCLPVGAVEHRTGPDRNERCGFPSRCGFEHLGRDTDDASEAED
jgi:hypothetical protein